MTKSFFRVRLSIVLIACAIAAGCSGGGDKSSGTISGNVQRLQQGNKLVLVNGTDKLNINSDGPFTFPTPVAANSSYAVAVDTQPSWQWCTVANGSGTVAANTSVSNVMVTCAAARANVALLAGSSTMGAADGTGAAASFTHPTGVAFDASGNAYIADFDNNMVRKIDQSGVVTTFAGSTTRGRNNGKGTSASFSNPESVAVDSRGNVYVADFNNNMVRKITPDGVVSTLAGSGASGSSDGTGPSASFRGPDGVTVDSTGNVYVADLNNNVIRKIAPSGFVTTIAGNLTPGYNDGQGAAASFNRPAGMAIDSAGNLYAADTGNNVIRKISVTGNVTTFAGSGAEGSTDGIATGASFRTPVGLTLDAVGNVFVADAGNNEIRKITSAGVVTTLAGSTKPGSANGIGSDASFGSPMGAAIDASSNIYVTDTGNNMIRKSTPIQ